MDKFTIGCIIAMLSVVTNKCYTESATTIFGNQPGRNVRNVARGKPTDQSTYSYGGVPARAVDGCYGSDWMSGCCTHTSTTDRAPWWSVNLTEVLTIHSISITNRGHVGLSNRLADFQVWVMSDSMDPYLSLNKTLCTHHEGIVQSGKEGAQEIYCDQAVHGQIVSIALLQRRSIFEPLTLCEVEVWAGDYILPCHCSNGTACNGTTGECLDGTCDTLLPEGYGWTGPACQVGNIAYGKRSESNTEQHAGHASFNNGSLWHSHDGILDGSLDTNLLGGSCSMVVTSGYQATIPWWTVDLEDVYAIYNITLVNTDTPVDFMYLDDLQISVGNSSDNLTHTLCARHSGPIGKAEHKTFDCNGTKIGRYVSVTKYQRRNYWGKLPLCEVIIWGHKWVDVDWNTCADASPNGIWCTSCYGDTSITCHNAPCKAGTYGVNCNATCGHCDGNATCSVRNGHCETCAAGWHSPLCQTRLNTENEHLNPETNGNRAPVKHVALIATLLVLCVAFISVVLIVYVLRKYRNRSYNFFRFTRGQSTDAIFLQPE